MESPEQRITASYSWAWKYASRCTVGFSNEFEREELRSAGILGYVVASSRYDDHRGSSFRSFCAARIRGAIVDEVRRSTWAPRSARRVRQVLSNTQSALDAALGRNSTDFELAQALGMDEIDLARLRQRFQPARCISLDDDTAAGTDDESLPLKDTLADQSAITPSSAASSAEIRHALFIAISKLPCAEASVIVLHYLCGIAFREIAQTNKLSPARISQMHRHGLTALRKHLGTETSEGLLGLR